MYQSHGSYGEVEELLVKWLLPKTPWKLTARLDPVKQWLEDGIRFWRAKGLFSGANC